MKKFVTVLLMAVMLFVFSGCTVEEKETKRTYKADGTYMVWELGVYEEKLLMPDGSTYTDADGKTVTVNTPVLSTVKVTIYNDKVVSYDIDELQSKPYVATSRTGEVQMDETTKVVKGVTWKFNDMTKKELEYGYNMEAYAAQGEWYIQILKLENYFLENGPKSDDTIKTSVTISFDNYVTLAQEALQNAKDGKVGAIVDKEHYTYDVTFVTGNVNSKGKLSNLELNAWLFGNVGENTYNPESTDYLKFAWNEKSKYDSYGEMSNGAKWQDQMDKLNEYINENAWDASLVPGTVVDDEFKDKGLNKGGEEVEALTSVTIQLSREVLVMNMLYKFFPEGWK